MCDQKQQITDLFMYNKIKINFHKMQDYLEAGKNYKVKQPPVGYINEIKQNVPSVRYLLSLPFLYQ